MKPTVERMPQRSLTIPQLSSGMMVSMAPQMVAVPAPPTRPRTIWGLQRQTKYLNEQRNLTDAYSAFLRSYAEAAKSYIAAARAATEVAELPEICASDTQVRRLQRERDFVRARRELEEERYALIGVQGEVDKLRRPMVERAAATNAAAIDALLKAKVNLEALGEDTTEIDQTIAALQKT